VAAAVALFSFSSQNPDELPITENEELTILLGQCDEVTLLLKVRPGWGANLGSFGYFLPLYR
jgi:hypothetical protein